MKRILTIFMILVTTTAISAQTQLTLDEAISIALNKNTTLIKAQNSLDGNESALKSAYGNLLPSVGLGTSLDWRRTEDPGGPQLNFYGQLDTLGASTSETRTYSAGISGRWNIFDGLANIATINQSGENLDAARFNYVKLKQDIILFTSQYYYQVINAEKMMGVREENVKYNQKFLETIQERNRLGSVPLADVYTQQVQLGNAELQFIQAENDYEQAKSTILNYLALDVLEEYSFVDPFADSEVNTNAYLQEFKDIKKLVDTAFENRVDYKAQKLVLESANSGSTIAYGGLYPSLSANYSYGSSATKVENLFDRKVFYVGLSLDLPIFSNWNTDYQIQLASIGVKNAEEDLSALERQIKIEIKQGYLNFVAGKKSLDVSSKNVKSAEENRNINYERYSLGSGTILEKLQADRDYQDALRSKINAEYEFYRLKDALLNYLGKLEIAKYE